MLCSCGCGRLTPIAKRNRREFGHVKGEHVAFAPGHRAGISLGFAVEDRGYLTSCYIWRGSTVGGGYGRTTRDGIQVLAHVAAWEAVYGPVPTGLTLDHLCRQPTCVNPDHLEAVTHAENCRRGAATKLTIEQARTIRYGCLPRREAAAAFGVSVATVDAIRAERLWKDI